MKEREIPHTHYIHRLSYSVQERIVGAFLLVAVGVLIWLVISASTAQISFEKYFTLYGQLQTQQDVNTNTEIVIAGLTAGKVEDVSVDKNNKILVKMHLLERYHSLVRTDSVAHINAFNLGVISKSVIELTAGNPKLPLLPSGSHIKIEASFSIKDLIARATPALDNLISTIDKINRILASVDPAKVKDSINNLNAISKNVLAMTNEIKSGDGIANKVLYDKQMANNILAVSNNLDVASKQFGQLADVLNKDLKSLPEIMNKVQPLVDETYKTIKATQRIWPLSSAIGEKKKLQQLTPQAPANDQ